MEATITYLRSALTFNGQLLRLSCTRDSEPIPRDRFPSGGVMVKAGGQHHVYGQLYKNEVSNCTKIY